MLGGNFATFQSYCPADMRYSTSRIVIIGSCFPIIDLTQDNTKINELECLEAARVFSNWL